MQITIEQMENSKRGSRSQTVVKDDDGVVIGEVLIILSPGNQAPNLVGAISEEICGSYKVGE